QRCSAEQAKQLEMCLVASERSEYLVRELGDQERLPRADHERRPPRRIGVEWILVQPISRRLCLFRIGVDDAQRVNAPTLIEQAHATPVSQLRYDETCERR